ncbi:hypothetical protein [Candidatus Mycoplasma mahonii]|uniref:hypothetical protein n=1 Tax=Candidatus Mycoplasma mahonii TaxID=3004105 RepID=UPI0026EB31EE|nr:hypothetical protein [Candidatus Mycoplasma mahonii]WKX02624.1 hypothetical protein O3I44_00905 [Candidatus Mycoplasma mahonii]
MGINTMKKELLQTSESILRRRNKINKVTIGVFVFIVTITILAKLIYGIMLDLGLGVDHLTNKANPNLLHQSFWLDKEIIRIATLTKNGKLVNEVLYIMVSHHPNFLWTFTQFTWITTIIILLFLVFRFFKYEERLPKWLSWIMTQRTLSLLAMYEIIVGVIFWSTMFSNKENFFIPKLYIFEFLITIFAHTVIPVIFVLYWIIHLLRDKDASLLKEGFVLKGMIFPVIYMFYYMLISQIWMDPYDLVYLHSNMGGNIWKLLLGLFLIWVLLGLMTLLHNIILLKFNKMYDPEYDYEVIKWRNHKIEKIKRGVRIKFINNRNIERELQKIQVNKEMKNKKIVEKKKRIQLKFMKKNKK